MPIVATDINKIPRSINSIKVKAGGQMREIQIVKMKRNGEMVTIFQNSYTIE